MRPTQSFPTPLKKKRRNKTLIRITWFFIVLICLFVGFGFLSHVPSLVIQDIDIKGTKVLDVGEVRNRTLEYLGGNVALFYARGNTLIYSKKKLTEFIKKEFPRVYEVLEITLENKKLEIVLEERRAAFTWCGHEAPVYEKRFEQEECYFLDQTGFIFDTSPFFTPGVYLSFYGGINRELSPIGQTIRTKNRIEDFRELIEAFEKHELSSHSIVVGPDGQNQFLLNNFSTTGDFAKILFNEESDLDDILDKVDFTFTEELFKEQFKTFSSKLEYIDTRFNNRVFYKFKEI